MFNVEMKSVGQELLDKGWRVSVYKNQLGSYTSIGILGEKELTTDHFTPKASINALASKIMEEEKNESTD